MVGEEAVWMNQELLLRLGYGQAWFQLDRRRMLELQFEHHCQPFDKDPYEPFRRLAMVRPSAARNPNKSFTSFRINDILSAEISKQASPTKRSHPAERRIDAEDNGRRPRSTDSGSCGRKKHRSKHSPRCDPLQTIIRPWDASSPTLSPSSLSRSCESSEPDFEEEIDVEGIGIEDEVKRARNEGSTDVSPLDALMEMSNKTFKGLESYGDSNRADDDSMSMKTQLPKKKRKTRTAFTNQQIYELEKRFLYQKYLTPADRDEIAAKLGLTCAQVITWFQNRRAKFKRDIEEMKNDVVATTPSESTDSKATKKCNTTGGQCSRPTEDSPTDTDADSSSISSPPC